MKLVSQRLLVHWLIASLLLVLPCNTKDGPIVTEQNTTGLSYGRLLVQILTEPENLVRLWGGWDLALQMMKIWAKNGAALATLPFNKEFFHNNKDFVHYAAEAGQLKSGLIKKFYYAQIPTMDPDEAPRFIKMTENAAGHARRDGAKELLYSKLKVPKISPLANYNPVYGDYSNGFDVKHAYDISNELRRRRRRSTKETRRISTPLLDLITFGH